MMSTSGICLANMWAPTQPGVVCGGSYERRKQTVIDLLCAHPAFPLLNMLVPVILKGVPRSGNYNPHVYKLRLTCSGPCCCNQAKQDSNFTDAQSLAAQQPREPQEPWEGSPLPQGGGLAPGQPTSVLSLTPVYYTNITIFSLCPDLNKWGNHFLWTL